MGIVSSWEWLQLNSIEDCISKIILPHACCNVAGWFCYCCSSSSSSYSSINPTSPLLIYIYIYEREWKSTKGHVLERHEWNETKKKKNLPSLPWKRCSVRLYFYISFSNDRFKYFFFFIFLRACALESSIRENDK